MKVVYNACYGGFGLSKKAVDLIAKMKGFDLDGMKYEYGGYISDDRSVNFGYDFNEAKNRSDKHLVEVVEALGKEASGSCADLQMLEIPDGSIYEIDEYDGFESVVPPRQSW